MAIRRIPFQLLAIVLAIGIVVDDAIVVVEAVEHESWKSTRNYRPAEATKIAMAQDHRAGHRHYACAAVGFRASRVHPGISGELFRQFAVTVAVVDAAVGDQRADAVAGALRQFC